MCGRSMKYGKQKKESSRLTRYTNKCRSFQSEDYDFVSVGTTVFGS